MTDEHADAVQQQAPGAAPAHAWDDRASKAGYPPDHGPEQRVLFTNPAMFKARPLAFVSVALFTLACAAGVIYGLAQGRTLITAPAGILLAVAAVVLLVWKVQQKSRSLEITNKRTVASVGLFSKSTSEVLHDNIRSVKIDQTFWERVWNIGTIKLSSSADGVEVTAEKMKDPENLRKIIDLYRPLG